VLFREPYPRFLAEPKELVFDGYDAHGGALEINHYNAARNGISPYILYIEVRIHLYKTPIFKIFGQRPYNYVTLHVHNRVSVPFIYIEKIKACFAQAFKPM
jgi:hypothetical protein